jgi:hypothetical protein
MKRVVRCAVIPLNDCGTFVCGQLCCLVSMRALLVVFVAVRTVVLITIIEWAFE